MRLLKANADGSFSLRRFLGGKVPSYAILTHTWEADDDEFIFQDLNDGTGRSKKGYVKVQFCGEQAKKDGLEYFWIDSCCIDQSSSAELSTAVNSMFRIYQRAAKCYAYLSDVSTGVHSSISHSRWFTRGWTLQELLAPPSVEFFSRRGTRLGDKESFGLEIQKITSNPIRALQGESLFRFSVDERMKWSAKRATTIEEDGAYFTSWYF